MTIAAIVVALLCGVVGLRLWAKRSAGPGPLLVEVEGVPWVGPASLLTDDESAIINEVGARLLRRAYPEALQTIDAHLPEASVALRAALLGQRGAVLHMTCDLAGARACYVEAAELEPDNPHYWWNVAEAEEQIGARDAAVDAVRRVLRLPVDVHTRREAEEMLVRLSA